MRGKIQWVSWVLVLSGGLAASFAVEWGGARGGRPQMPGYRIPPFVQAVEVKPVRSVHELLPAARACVKDWLGVGPEERVVMAADSSTSPLLVRAFETAIREQGASAHLAQVSWRPPPFPERWPERFPQLALAELASALREADAAVIFPYLDLEQEEESLRAFLKPGARLAVVSAVPELLTTSWWSYPGEVLQAIEGELGRRFAAGSALELVDPAGTHLKVSRVSPLGFSPAGSSFYFPHAPQFRLRPGPGKTSGVVGIHAFQEGFFPLMELTVEGGSIIRLRGGGRLGEGLRRLWAFRSLNPPSPGAYRLEEIRVSVHPKAFRLTRPWEPLTDLWGYHAASLRAGVVTLRFHSLSELPPLDFRLFYPDLLWEGAAVIRKGYLAALDSQAVRLAAAAHPEPELLTVQCAAMSGEPLPLPEPKSPSPPSVRGAQELLPGLKPLMEDWLSLQPQDRVLVLTDSTVPSMVSDALLQAAARRGVKARVQSLSVVEANRKKILSLEEKLALPESQWKEIQQSDFILAPTIVHPAQLEYQGENLGTWISKNSKRWVRVGATPELLASPAARFPKELLLAVGRKTLEWLDKTTSLSLTDQRGTELILDVARPAAGYDGKHELPLRESVGVTHYPPSLRIPVLPKLEGFAVARGTLWVASALYEAIPTLKIEIEGGKIVRLEGSAEGVPLRAGLFLQDLRWGTNPKAARYEKVAGDFSPRAWNYLGGTLRSGVLTLRFGPSPPGTAPPDEIPYEAHLFFPTLTLEGASMIQSIIENGHLDLWDTPELKSAAAPFGDPDQLLMEDWIPAVRKQ